MNQQTMRTWTEIRLDNLEHNYQVLRACAPQSKFLGVVKANAYGHGAEEVAHKLQQLGADYLAVACLNEAIELRQSGITMPILILGATPAEFAPQVVEHDLTQAVFTLELAQALSKAAVAQGKRAKIHVKLDTGMSRLGILAHDPAQAARKVDALCALEGLEAEGIFTHFANAENREKTQLQIDKWNNVLSQIDTTGLLLHIQNTVGTMCYDIPESNMRRVGIALYGLWTDMPDDKGFRPNLKPVMSVKGRIVNVHTAKDGEGVSYGYTFVAKGDRTIATIPIGYADGVSRGLSNKIFGVLNGKKVPQVGNITMDQMMFDITGVEAEIGDIITLIGDEISIDEWAKTLGTINYELCCRLKVRLPRVYTR